MLLALTAALSIGYQLLRADDRARCVGAGRADYKLRQESRWRFGSDDSQSFTITEVDDATPDSGIGGTIWETSIALSCLLAGRKTLVGALEIGGTVGLCETGSAGGPASHGLGSEIDCATGLGRTLEIGAGVGLVGHAVSALGTATVLTDVRAGLVENLAASLQQFSNAKAATLDWKDDGFPGLPQYDTIIGADIIYYWPDIAPVVATIDRLLAPGGTCYISAPKHRSVGIAQDLASALRKVDFDVDQRKYVLVSEFLGGDLAAYEAGLALHDPDEPYGTGEHSVFVVTRS
jgi:SAM-dependent methyltransferase